MVVEPAVVKQVAGETPGDIEDDEEFLLE